jgi:hypothetical protein
MKNHPVVLLQRSDYWLLRKSPPLPKISGVKGHVDWINIMGHLHSLHLEKVSAQLSLFFFPLTLTRDKTRTTTQTIGRVVNAKDTHHLLALSLYGSEAV